jgi:hypothetical protein
MIKRPDQLVAYPNLMPYPTNIGAPKFEPLPISSMKDTAKNIARYHVNEKLQELNDQYQLIVKQAEMIQQQAQKILSRVKVTDLILEAEYQFKPVPYNVYYLVWDTEMMIYRLLFLGPDDWVSLPPLHFIYYSPVRLLGDSTWEIISEKN